MRRSRPSQPELQATLDYDVASHQVDIASMTGATRLVNHDALQRLAQILHVSRRRTVPSRDLLRTLHEVREGPFFFVPFVDRGSGGQR